MADRFPDAQRYYDNQLPPYLENEDAPCDECGDPFEDHCEDCLNCTCICDDDEEEEE
jgi:hypothetical protein